MTANDAATGGTVTGACFSLFANLNQLRGEFAGNACDHHDGQSTIAGLAGGGYILAVACVEPGSGYLVGGDRMVQVASPGPSNVTFPLARGGREVRVLTVAEGSGAPQGNNTFLEGACDPSDSIDGSSDGRTSFSGLPAGDYVLWQFDWPGEYVVAPYVTFTVDGTTDATVTVENVPIDSLDISVIIQMIIDILIDLLSDI